MTKAINMQSPENSRKFPKTLTEREFRFVNDYVRGKRSRQQTKDFLLHVQSTFGVGDMFDCAICGQAYIKLFPPATLEHIKPKACGGASDISNHAITCLYCNGLKGSEHSIDATRNRLVRKHKEVNADVAEDALRRVQNAREWCAKYEKGHYINPYSSVLYVGLEGPLRSSGWNFVGFPDELSDSSIDATFTSDIEVRTAYAYDPTIPGGWQVAVRETLADPWQGDLTHLKAHNGYCVLSDAEHQEIRIPIK